MSFFLSLYFLFLLYSFFQIIRKWFHRKHHSCYIINYECFLPSDDRKINTEICFEIGKRNKNLTLDDFNFAFRIMERCGVGEETYLPRSILEGREMTPTLSDAIMEMEEFFYQTLDSLFSKSSISPSDIDVLVVNVSSLAPTPSLSARIVNHYKMREDIKVYNLSGMGCSASIISLNLVQSHFETYKNLYALILTSESIAPNWYQGNEKSMMLTNILFRSAGSAILLSNKPSLKHKAMFKLKHLVRTHLAASDDAYECLMQREDEHGYSGFTIGDKLPMVADQAIRLNFRELAPKIVPVWELLRYIYHSSFQGKANMNFKTGIDHFIIHTGGRKILDTVGKSLGLSEYDLEPSRMSLYRFGNTAAASIWYVLAYMEAKKRLKKGNTVLMINPGGGFKFNTCVLEVVNDLEGENVWKHCIDSYPQKTTGNTYAEKYGWMSDIDSNTFELLRRDDKKMKEHIARWIRNKNN
ncbi:very-long-chain 3-oxoacyl-CoA synthase [Ranunculus cassubicifolius]